MHFNTRCIHGPGPAPDHTGAISAPIYQTATFAHPGVGRSTGFDYTRCVNPTRCALEETLASLESGAAALAFTSGMSAIATVAELFSPGDHLVVSADVYGGTHRLFADVSAKNGLRFTRAGSADQIAAAIEPSTVAVFVETPTNPMMQVVDIDAVARATHAAGALLIVDNTFLTPFFQRPLELGADIVVHSATKYLAGHNDTLAGVVVVSDAALAERIGSLRSTLGGPLAPFDSWLVLRGLKTLACRMERQTDSAARLADWLAAHPAVTQVYYPGLASPADLAISQRQASGHGAMISFRVVDQARAHRVLASVRVIQFAESLGGAESLITYPLTQTHAEVPEAQRRELGIDATLLRLSVGLEDPRDLIADLASALAPPSDSLPAADAAVPR
ncbi:MAG: PLP-dependent aspartate aminotransferase family protein [Bifidobacteriaceae bacterium]|jgi:cystathionine beta-lyase/cystathionine gamma-synthase|nr:PLP-dependent aspartate aminotransferase family protein [Bifidobacteriaceae bacterium]